MVFSIYETLFLPFHLHSNSPHNHPEIKNYYKLNFVDVETSC